LEEVVVKKWKDPNSGAPNLVGSIAIDIGVWCESSIPIAVREFTILIVRNICSDFLLKLLELEVLEVSK
jgi:hypothetical protein